MLCAQNDLSYIATLLFPLFFLPAVSLSVYHPSGDLAHVGVFRARFLYYAAVTDDYQLVAKVDDFIKPVRDEYYRDALFGELLQRRDKDAGLALSKDGGRLVEDQQPRLASVYFAGYLCELLVPYGHFADQCVGVEIDP